MSHARPTVGVIRFGSLHSIQYDCHQHRSPNGTANYPHELTTACIYDHEWHCHQPLEPCYLAKPTITVIVIFIVVVVVVAAAAAVVVVVVVPKQPRGMMKLLKTLQLGFMIFHVEVCAFIPERSWGKYSRPQLNTGQCTFCLLGFDVSV